MHLSPKQGDLASVRSKTEVLLLICCWLLLPLFDSVIVLCFVVRYFVSILVLQSSRWGRESWLLCFVCLPGGLRLLWGSSSRCHGVFCSLWLSYFLIILINYFWQDPSYLICSISILGQRLSFFCLAKILTHLHVSLAFFLREIGKQHKTRSDAT